jgi:hypothetical protein
MDMIAAIMTAIGSQAKSLPSWIVCAMMAWIGVELAKINKSVGELSTAVAIMKVQLEDHIKYAHILQPKTFLVP